MERKQKNTWANQKGITLIVLAVTIVVLLVLAGISLSALIGENGLISRTKEAKDLVDITTEKETIDRLAVSARMNGTLDYLNKYFIGTTLATKTVSGANWDIVVINDTQEIYGTGWNYIENGTEINNYGTTKYNWLVNYKTGEVIYLEENNYQELSNSLAVTDGLIFCMDSSNLDENASNWGNNITLYYYDDTIYDTMDKRLEAYNEQANYTSVVDYAGYDRQIAPSSSNYVDTENLAFRFNGNNYIEIYDDTGFDFSDGLTFEFYGNIEDTVRATTSGSAFIGLFGLWSGKYDVQCQTRFGCLRNTNYLRYSLITWASGIEDYGSWPEADYPWNQQYKVENLINNDIYFTITLDTLSSDSIIQTIYINGEYLDSGYITKEYYNEFLERSKDLNYLELGRCTMTEVSNWCYTKGLCYTTRMYNRALNSDEVSNNYTATIAYRNLLLNSD